jgi:site-specific recombinase XerD
MKKSIFKLVKECVDYFTSHCYTVSRIQRYKWMWKIGIERYMSNNQLTDYDREVGEAFISERISSCVTPGERDIMRSVRVLSEFLETGSVSKKSVHHRTIALPGETGVYAQLFIDNQKRERRSQSTLVSYRLFLHYFITHLNRFGIESVADVREEHLLGFLSSLTNNKVGIASTLRLFFRFLYAQKQTFADLSYILSGYKFERREKLPSVYRKEEVAQIESSIIRTNGAGKRDYAILLLATRLGLRASDIAYLTFSNLDWEHNMIRLQQFKTGKEIELPLLVDIGEAIISYLKHGRQQANVSNVFLSARAPYRPMTGCAVSTSIRQAIEKSGVHINKRRHGSHSMRHSLAVRLLEDGVPLPVISESLGHASSSSTGAYLKVDVTGLRQCALEVPTVNKGFYDQKGGVFYE